MTPEEFRAELAKHGVKLSDEQMQQFQTYYEFLVATNEHVNLTAITKQDEVYLKHFYDSLLPALEVKDLQTRPFSICDVGAGAGFPSIPLKIAFPNLKVTIVDSLNKRIKFLEELSQAYPNDYIILVMDNAVWHKSQTLEVPSNIEFTFIPPYTPEMNPIEQVWSEIRKCGFKNQTFPTLEAVIDRLQAVIQSLSHQTLKSIV